MKFAQYPAKDFFFLHFCVFCGQSIPLLPRRNSPSLTAPSMRRAPIGTSLRKKACTKNMAWMSSRSLFPHRPPMSPCWSPAN